MKTGQAPDHIDRNIAVAVLFIAPGVLAIYEPVSRRRFRVVERFLRERVGDCSSRSLTDQPTLDSSSCSLLREGGNSGVRLRCLFCVGPIDQPLHVIHGDRLVSADTVQSEVAR